MSNTYTLYWCPDTASLAPRIVLEEAGLDYEVVEVDIRQGAHRAPAYLAINPVGLVPALALPGGEILTESAAISLYLAERHPETGLAPAMGDPLRGLFLRSLFYLADAVQPAYKVFFYPQRFTNTAAHAAEVKAQAADNVIAAWRPVEAHLAAAGPYHLGASCSLVDIYMLMLSTWFEPIDDLAGICPAVGAACDLVRARPSVQRCLDWERETADDG
jgi:glutathione S-transferase